jgi:sec-independent protein translocase protein TatC
MSDPADLPQPDAEEEGGGPVKSFLEHLEDLRWVLIKVSVAVLVAMTVCLLAVNKVVAILKWPLERARLLDVPAGTQVNLLLGTNKFGSFFATNNQFGDLDLGATQRVVNLSLEPVAIGTNSVLTLKLVTNAPGNVVVGKGPDLIYLDPAAPFVSSLHIAFFAGILLAAPFVFYHVGQFLVPALKIKEKKVFLRAFAVGVLLFMTGVCFCYFGIMPLALRAAEAYSNWMGIQMPDWRAETYFSFVTKFMLGMGLGFEMPVVILALVKIGLLDYRKLAAFRRYMIIVNLILGALLTTPEVLTQVMMFIPLQILYEISIWIAWYWEREERKKSEVAV